MNLTNQVAIRQNQQDALILRAGARALYARAKMIRRWQFGLMVVIPLCLFAAGFLFEQLQPWASLYGFVITAIGYLALDPLFFHRRMLATQVAERFDCEVLGLPPNHFLLAGAPTQEQLVKLALRGESADPTIADWYGPVPVELESRSAQLLCQRMNLTWDAELRNAYARLLALALLAFVVAVLSIGLFRDQSLAAFLLGTGMPTLPIGAWLIATWKQHVGTRRRLGDLIEAVDQHFAGNGGIARQINPRDLQDAIYLHRSTAALVPDWLYKITRNANQATMKVSTAALLEKVRSSGQS